MPKKILVLMLTAAMVLSFAACGESAQEPATAADAESVETTPGNEVLAEEENPEASEESEMTFTEQVLVDDENCTVKVTGIEEDALWGYALKVFLENKTDLELMYTVEDVSVNGFMCDPFWASSVTAQMKANEEISFFDEMLKNNGIEAPTDITFTLRVYDNNDWAAEELVEQEFTIYPMGEEAVRPYERTAQPGDIVLVDNEQCGIIVTGFEMDEIWGYTMKVYLENKTDMELMFSTDGVAVNGFMCDPFWAQTVSEGKRSNSEICWYAESLAENGISEVTQIVLPVRVYDNNDWMADDLVNQTFTVNP